MKNRLRCCIIVLGIVCMVASGLVVWQARQEEQVAQTVSAQEVQAFYQDMEGSSQEMLLVEDLEPISMIGEPEKTIKPVEYTWLMFFPQLDLELPVASTCSYANLANSPCVYSGSVAGNNLVIGAHNYQSHFGRIDELDIGDQITLMDQSGVTYTYAVTAQEQVDGTDLEGLLSGTWDLTLFTCLYGDNTQRVLVRLEVVN